MTSFGGGAVLFDLVRAEGALADVVDALAPLLRPKTWLLLDGDLGAGKTTLTAALLHRLGALETARSPTFGVLAVIPLDRARVDAGPVPSPAPERAVHLDLYRVKSGRELAFLGLEVEFDARSVCVFEWPSRVESEEWEEFFALTGCRRPASVLSLEILEDDEAERSEPSPRGEERPARRYVASQVDPFP